MRYCIWYDNIWNKSSCRLSGFLFALPQSSKSCGVTISVKQNWSTEGELGIVVDRKGKEGQEGESEEKCNGESRHSRSFTSKRQTWKQKHPSEQNKATYLFIKFPNLVLRNTFLGHLLLLQSSFNQGFMSNLSWGVVSRANNYPKHFQLHPLTLNFDSLWGQ